MSYDVKKMFYLHLKDFHHAIFVQNKEDGNGEVFHETGEPMKGFTYERKPAKRYGRSIRCVGDEKLSTVKIENFERFVEILESLEVPGKQMVGFRRLPGPVKNCQTWVAAGIKALKEADVLEEAADEGDA